LIRIERKRRNDGDPGDVPAKKMKEEPLEIKADPFEVLPEDCYRMIFEYIDDALHLYNMTKVSTLWQSIVEGDKRAAAKVDELQTLEIRRARDEKDIRSGIGYRHLTFFHLSRSSLGRYAESLETLTVKNIQSWHSVNPLIFPALRELSIRSATEDCIEWISNSIFPVLTDLNIQGLDFRSIPASVENMFANMPNLKRLHSDYLEYENQMYGVDDGNYPKFPEPQFRLDSLYIGLFNVNVFKSQGETLKLLKCYVRNTSDFANILSNLTSLKSLSVDIRDKLYHEGINENRALIRNESITKFEFRNFKSLTECNRLISIISLLPSLEVISVYPDESRTVYIYGSPALLDLARDLR
jgi:hypothetical protein